MWLFESRCVEWVNLRMNRNSNVVVSNQLKCFIRKMNRNANLGTLTYSKLFRPVKSNSSLGRFLPYVKFEFGVEVIVRNDVDFAEPWIHVSLRCHQSNDGRLAGFLLLGLKRIHWTLSNLKFYCKFLSSDFTWLFWQSFGSLYSIFSNHHIDFRYDTVF